jgi:hypothetical protein
MTGRQPISVQDATLQPRRPLLGLPLDRSRTADPVLAAHIGRLHPNFLLPQNPNDPLFLEPARLRVHPLRGDGSTHLEEISWLSPFIEKSLVARRFKRYGCRRILKSKSEFSSSRININ